MWCQSPFSALRTYINNKTTFKITSSIRDKICRSADAREYHIITFTNKTILLITITTCSKLTITSCILEKKNINFKWINIVKDRETQTFDSWRPARKSHWLLGSFRFARRMASAMVKLQTLGPRHDGCYVMSFACCRIGRTDRWQI